MPGQVLVEAFDELPDLERVPSYEALREVPADARPLDSGADAQILEQLRRLGYAR